MLETSFYFRCRVDRFLSSAVWDVLIFFFDVLFQTPYEGVFLIAVFGEEKELIVKKVVTGRFGTQMD